LIRGPVRPDRRSALRFASLRWAALPIVDRRWTAPMSAVALAFGLFIGVAIGPGTQGSFGDSPATVVQVAAPPTETAVVDPGTGGGAGGHQSTGGGGSSPGAGPAEIPPPPGPSTPPPAPPSFVPTTPSFVPTTPSFVPTTPSFVPTTPIAPTTTTPAAGTDGLSTTLTGTVVHVNPEAASYAIASEGRLLAIHSHRPPAVGDVVEVTARPLVNGTYGENGDRTNNGSRGRAQFSGTVSFRDPATAIYTVSAPGVSVLVRGGAQHAPPDVGDRVDVRARFADHPEALAVTPPGHEGCGAAPEQPKPPRVALEQTRLEITDSQRAATTDLEGVVEGLCRDSRTLILSADDVRESGRDIQVSLPSSIRLADLANGQALKLSASVAASGAFTVTSVAADGDRSEADDPDLAQP
jgi:hypothetical protein